MSIEGPLAILCADVGSVVRGNFGWAGIFLEPERRVTVGGSDIAQLAETAADNLDNGVPVALGFECPLFVPVSHDPARLTSARRGEGRRAWSAGGGSGALATGLTETVWLLRRVRELLSSSARTDTRAHLEWSPFVGTGEGLFLWEAFVSDTGKGESSSHVGDAEIAVRSFENSLPNPDGANAIRSDEEVHSLLGAAMLRTGWSTDLTVLSRACLVIKA